MYDKIDARGNTDLHVIASTSYDGDAQLFLEENGLGCIDARNNDGDTALHIAAMRGSHAMVECLLKYQANVFIANDVGETVHDILARSSGFS